MNNEINLEQYEYIHEDGICFFYNDEAEETIITFDKEYYCVIKKLTGLLNKLGYKNYIGGSDGDIDVLVEGKVSKESIIKHVTRNYYTKQNFNNLFETVT